MAIARAYEETSSPNLKREPDIYDVHRQAVSDWHNACKEAEMAIQRRDQLRVELEKITHDFAQHLARNEYDPTKPQPPENGAIARQVPGRVSAY